MNPLNPLNPLRTPADLRDVSQTASAGADAPLAARSRVGYRIAWIAGILALVSALYWPTVATMADVWWRSETFAHGFVVAPLFLWLVYLRRAQLDALDVRPSPWGLVALAATGAAWLLAELTSSATPAQFAVVAMVAALVLGLLGWSWLRTLAFPLAFLAFAVPFGESLVPVMIDWTADFTVGALRVVGVPVYREGTLFVIPSGQWSVVEACSGFRYLIASFMVGCLFAWTTYRSPRRRLLFVAASIVVPIVANWLRAFGIVMLGHLSDNRIAADADHLIYGWLFFGLVTCLLFVIGARWREDLDPAADRSNAGRETGLAASTPAPVPATAALAATKSDAPLGSTAGPSRTRRYGIPQAMLSAAVVLAAWPLLLGAAAAPPSAAPLAIAPIAAANGWTPVEEPANAWRPDLDGAGLHARQMFEKNGERVGIHVALYRDQRQGAELVSDMNQFARNENPRWKTMVRGVAVAPLGGESVGVATALMRGAEGRVLAWRWYWLGDLQTSSDVRAKLELARARLLRRPDASAWVAIYSPAEDGAEAAHRRLERFAREMGPALDRSLREATWR